VETRKIKQVKKHKMGVNQATKLSLFLCVISISGVCFAQSTRGTLLQKNNPLELQAFFTDSLLDLTILRNTSNLLTNNDITVYDNLPLPRRKKAFIRHVKHLNETLEKAYLSGQKMKPENLDLLYELLWYKQSLIQKGYADANPKIILRQKIQFLRDTRRSKRVFTYRIPFKYRFPTNPEDSPFWQAIPDSISPYTRFNQLAKEKKIKAKANMVVLFEEVSWSGSAPKIDALDLDLDNGWTVKWGDEVHTDVAGSRIFAALGYDVDHPYFYGTDLLTLVFDETNEVCDKSSLVAALKAKYSIDISPFISTNGSVTAAMSMELPTLEPFIGKQFVRFKKCAIEARPDRVKRLGSFLPEGLNNGERQELKGAVLAHHFIGNWDTKESNTLLTTVHKGNYTYQPSAVFSDLGTSFGVCVKPIRADFKVGLVNEFPWEVIECKRNKLKFTNSINTILQPYEKANYTDLLWMATKIRALDEKSLRKIIAAAQWPAPIAELYFHKLASRRASILAAFRLEDPHPIAFNRKLNWNEGETKIIENGTLLVDYQRLGNPESFLETKGRFRNYGN
jgi:hypothetical protein